MEVEALKKNKLKLEILDPTGVVVRTHHFIYEAQYGSRLKVTVGDNTYMMDRDGEMIEKPDLDIGKEWATEYKKNLNPTDEPRYYNPESQDTQKLFDKLIPVWNVTYKNPSVGYKGEGLYYTVEAKDADEAKSKALANMEFTKHIAMEFYDSRYLTAFTPIGIYVIGKVEYFEGDPRL